MRTALFSISLLGCVLAGSAAQSGSSQPCPQSTDRTFYSDPEMLNEVGGIYIDCDGQLYRWGRITNHVQIDYLPCNCGPYIP